MARALNELVGTHDFAAFQKAGSSRSHSCTTIEEVDIQREGDILSIEIQATGFLYGMCRLLFGQLAVLYNHLTLPWKRTLVYKLVADHLYNIIFLVTSH